MLLHIIDQRNLLQRIKCLLNKFKTCHNNDFAVEEYSPRILTMIKKSTVDCSASSTMSASSETRALPSMTLLMTLQTLTCMYISLYLQERELMSCKYNYGNDNLNFMCKNAPGSSSSPFFFLKSDNRKNVVNLYFCA